MNGYTNQLNAIFGEIFREIGVYGSSFYVYNRGLGGKLGTMKLAYCSAEIIGTHFIDEISLVSWESSMNDQYDQGWIDAYNRELWLRNILHSRNRKNPIALPLILFCISIQGFCLFFFFFFFFIFIKQKKINIKKSNKIGTQPCESLENKPNIIYNKKRKTKEDVDNINIQPRDWHQDEDYLRFFEPFISQYYDYMPIFSFQAGYYFCLLYFLLFIVFLFLF